MYLCVFVYMPMDAKRGVVAPGTEVMVFLSV